jgi:hypothetical protein
VLWLVAISLDAPLPLPAAAFVALTVDVLAAVPLTPGGVGQIDAAYAALLALLALPIQQVGAVVLLVRFITYWSFLAFSGLITLLGGFGSLLPSALATGSGQGEAQLTGLTTARTQTTVAQPAGEPLPYMPSTDLGPSGEEIVETRGVTVQSANTQSAADIHAGGHEWAAATTLPAAASTTTNPAGGHACAPGV